MAMMNLSALTPNKDLPSFHKQNEYADHSRTQGKSIVSIGKDSGEYLLEHDANYITRACFHIKYYWLFVRGPVMNEVVIRRLYRRIKDASGDSFKVLPISGIIRNEEVNPFESSTVLRLGYSMTSCSNQSHKSIEVENQSFGSEDLLDVDGYDLGLEENLS